MPKSFREWLTEGESLYQTALEEYQALESQIEQLEQQLAAKKADVNEIAAVVGKPPVESHRRVTAELIENPDPQVQGSAPAGAVARALSGRGLLSRP